MKKLKQVTLTKRHIYLNFQSNKLLLKSYLSKNKKAKSYLSVQEAYDSAGVIAELMEAERNIVETSKKRRSNCR